MIRVPPALEKASLRARMLLQVHDELLLEVPEGEVEKTSAVVREVMENACHPAVQLSVPLVADAGTGRKIGRASCRERVGQYGESSGAAVAFNKTISTSD